MLMHESAWSSPRWTGNLPLFTLHVLRDLVCVRITFQTTGPSPPALEASSTSSRLLDLTGTGRWHRSRVPKVLLEHSWSYAVVSTLGLVRCHSAALAVSRSYHMSRFDDEHRLTPCRHVRLTHSCLCAIIRRLPTRLGSTREWVHGACIVGRV